MTNISESASWAGCASAYRSGPCESDPRRLRSALLRLGPTSIASAAYRSKSARPPFWLKLDYTGLGGATVTAKPIEGLCGKAVEAGLKGAAAGERLLRRAAAGSTGEPVGGATGGTAEAAARGRRPGGDMRLTEMQRRTRTRTTTGGRNHKHGGRTPRTGSKANRAGAETARARTARTRINAEPRHRLPPVSSCAHNTPPNPTG